MRAFVLETGFGLDNLVLRERETPMPGPGQVLLEMRTASLNYRDLVVVAGGHGRAVRPPLVPLSDGVGIVVETGPGVRDLAVGDRVAPAFYQHWQGGAPPDDLEAGRLGGPLQGVLASHCVFPESGLVKIAETLSNAEAATLPCAGVTAWSALSEPWPLRPGESVLIQGTGGVALMALALARRAGARTIVTTSSPIKAARLAGLGADLVIDRNATPDWARAVREATGGRGCERVLELGGAATLNESVKAVRTGGTILLIGNVTGSMAELFLPLVLTRRITLHSVSCGSRQAFQALMDALAAGGIRPVVDRVFPFEEAHEAFRTLEKGEHFGNICLSLSQDPSR